MKSNDLSKEQLPSWGGSATNLSFHCLLKFHSLYAKLVLSGNRTSKLMVAGKDNRAANYNKSARNGPIPSSCSSELLGLQ